VSEQGGREEAVPAVSAVRPFMLTEGRAYHDDGALPMETQVVATPEALQSSGRLAFERRAIIEACGTPMSLAEVASRLGLHLNVVRVLVGDLRAMQYLTVHVPRAANTDLDVLRRVIDGLRAIHTSPGTRDA
jgi:Protein of unknown function (DUF742)